MEQLSPRVLQLTREYISHGYGYDLALEYAERVEREEREEKISVERENIITILEIKSRHRGKLCKDHQGNSFESKRKMCKVYNITTWAFSKRIKDGWSLERALMQPMKKRR